MLYRTFCNIDEKSNPNLIATEAETTTGTEDKSTKPEFVEVKGKDPNEDAASPEKREKAEQKSSAFADNIKALISEMLNNFARMFDSVGVKVSLMMETDKGFIKEYTRAKKSYKPNGTVEVIQYKYEDRVLDATRNNFQKVISDLNRVFSNITYGQQLDASVIIEGTNEEYTRKLLNALKAPSSCNTMSDFMKLVRAQFLGRKRQVTYTPDDISRLEPIAMMKSDALKVRVRNDQSYVYQSSNKITNNLQLVTRNKELSDETRSRSEKYLRRIIAIQQDYQSFLNMYYSLKMSKINNARAILKRLFNI